MTQKLCLKQVSKDFRKALNNSCKAYSFLIALNMEMLYEKTFIIDLNDQINHEL